MRLVGHDVGASVAWDLIQTFLAADFSGDARHLRRLSKVTSSEAHDRRTAEPAVG
jgi:ribose 5-phosphate isomerase B